MANPSVFPTDDPRNLLSATSDLTWRVRLTQRGAWWALWADAHPVFLADTLRLGPSHPTDLVRRVASPAGAIGLALLVLARIERSWPLLSLSLAYLVANVVPVYAGSFRHPTPWAFLPHVLLTGGALLMGGVVVALIQRHPGSSAA